jgi:hypothetical protein
MNDLIGRSSDLFDVCPKTRCVAGLLFYLDTASRKEGTDQADVERQHMERSEIEKLPANVELNLREIFYSATVRLRIGEANIDAKFVEVQMADGQKAYVVQLTEQAVTK